MAVFCHKDNTIAIREKNLVIRYALILMIVMYRATKQFFMSGAVTRIKVWFLFITEYEFLCSAEEFHGNNMAIVLFLYPTIPIP